MAAAYEQLGLPTARARAAAEIAYATYLGATQLLALLPQDEAARACRQRQLLATLVDAQLT